MDPIIRIMLVDDHEIFRIGLKQIISSLGYAKVVGEAENGLDFLRLIETTETDIVLMDIQMPVMDGIEATRRAKEMKPGIKILALSTFKEETYIQQMIALGARGFLLKNIRKDALDRALQAVYNGRTYYSEELWDYFTRSMAREDDKPQIVFTKRENEILQLLVKGLSNKEIAEILFVSERTIVGHKTNLLSKTNCKNTVALLSFAIRSGLVHME
jgi:DNA-binding NarL/FixJ family response regulator